MARSQFDRGADVVFAAAGGTGVGVYQAAKDSGKYAIGVDSNQNHLHPGTMLTSMVKRVDVAVAEAYQSVIDDTWSPGIKVLGLSEDGVAWALDDQQPRPVDRGNGSHDEGRRGQDHRRRHHRGGLHGR